MSLLPAADKDTDGRPLFAKEMLGNIGCLLNG